MPARLEPRTMRITQHPGRPCRVKLGPAKHSGRAAIAEAAIDVVTFPIPSTPITAGTTRSAFTNVTSQVAGHSSYQIAIDTTAWQPADQITIQIEFRIDNVVATNSGCKITTTGGAHHDIQGNPIFPSCGAAIPTFQTNLAARAIVTVPSSGTIQGSIDLI